MWKFAHYRSSDNRRNPELRGAYLVGVDGVPVRGDLRVNDNVIACEARNQEPLALSVLWPVDGFGVVQLQTTRLPVQEQPYNLNVELLRHRLMRLTVKCEEWGLYDYPGMNDIATDIEQVRTLFLDTLQHADDPPAAAKLADKAMSVALRASEALCQFHASVFLSRRRQTEGLTENYLGVSLPPSVPAQAINKDLTSVVDFAQIPFAWSEIQPDEKSTRYAPIDTLIKSCTKAGLGLRGGPVLNFGVRSLPDWLHVWENDYEAITSFAREHVRRTVTRYAKQIGTWVVASGLHADNVFPFNFEQIIDLTRLAVGVTRQAAPQARVIIDITEPWGEYYARNQRTAPPLLYAEMALQAGINFDAFGVQFLFGLNADGFHVRDMLEISTLIDRLAGLGKPLHVTAVAVPSDASAVETADRDWSGQLQAQWLAAFCEMALSRPYIESICLQTLTDAVCPGIPSGGVLDAKLAAKPALERLKKLRRELKNGNASGK